MSDALNMDVVLFHMPFAPVDRPSIGLTLLAQCLTDAGFQARVDYPSLDFVGRIGISSYEQFSLGWFASMLVGEWIFSRLVSPAGDMDDMVASLQRRIAEESGIADGDGLVLNLAACLPTMVEAATELVDQIVTTVGKLRPRVVGLSSCYHQHLACLAAAKRIKETYPEIVIVLGGTNCNGVMGAETFRQFPFLDAVVSGPGEIALVELVRRVKTGDLSSFKMPGVYVRAAGIAWPTGITAGTAPEPVLDTVPLVDFTDFFQRYDDGDEPFVIPIEASRGCWWGQKHHCVFCSENAESMRYRAKSPERVLEEFNWLLDRHPGRRISATDEILDPRLIDSIMPALAVRADRRQIFFSVKANLRKSQLRVLAEAGVDALQPGIESLDDDILRQMRKGVTTLQNVQLLKWCREFGISVSWGILFGFPFDNAEAYHGMAELLPLLTHLTPPAMVPVKLQRYSPLFMDGKRFGLTDFMPNESYRFIYPFADPIIERLAFRFTSPSQDLTLADDFVAPVRQAVRDWRDHVDQRHLVFLDQSDRTVIHDTRPVATRRIHFLEGLERAVFLACDAAQPIHALCRDLRQDADGTRIGAILTRLVEDRLMVERQGLYLALPVRVTRRSLPPVAVMVDLLAAQASHRREEILEPA
jgi:ribosomal peptide maturation radical SAM protein 1